MAADAIAALPSEQKVRVELDAADDVLVRGDPMLLGTALSNAIDNALKFSTDEVFVQVHPRARACARRADPRSRAQPIDAVEGATLVEPGARTRVDFTLHRPVALEPGIRFAIREGGKTIGAGVVTEVR